MELAYEAAIPARLDYFCLHAPVKDTSKVLLANTVYCILYYLFSLNISFMSKGNYMSEVQHNLNSSLLMNLS
jgi:hypothetical protein